MKSLIIAFHLQFIVLSNFENRFSERSENVERRSTNFFTDLHSVEVFVLPRVAVIPSAILGYGSSSEDRGIVGSQVWVYDQLAVEHQAGSTDRWKRIDRVEWWNATLVINYNLIYEILDNHPGISSCRWSFR